MQKVKVFTQSVGDLQGFTGYSTTINAIIVSFRGSSNIQNWIVHLSANMVSYPKCSSCKVHAGFYASWNLIKSTIMSQLQSLTALYRNAPIYLTGHSLGGALASLAGPDVKQTYKNVKGMITFGEPRVGNSHYSKYFSSVVDNQRVIHYADVVPHLPPTNMDFMHEGR